MSRSDKRVNSRHCVTLFDFPILSVNAVQSVYVFRIFRYRFHCPYCVGYEQRRMASKSIIPSIWHLLQLNAHELRKNFMLNEFVFFIISFQSKLIWSNAYTQVLRWRNQYIKTITLGCKKNTINIFIGTFAFRSPIQKHSVSIKWKILRKLIFHST